MTPAIGLALPCRAGPVVFRCFGHDEAVREARGAAELVAGWARRKRTDVRIHTNKIEAGRLPGQADGSTQAVYDCVVRIARRAAAEAAGALKERWRELETPGDGSYLGWADDAAWEA
eukprot:7297624-Alexandrium_andersonii.AAC.1